MARQAPRGSTPLKAGTGQTLVLNAISTFSIIRLAAGGNIRTALVEQ
jgi:N-acetylmuramic acid 6-phosphate (MurNAc-6-P) etherase